MIRNYFKIAWRNIWKNKLFSFINIISLAIGLSASFVIGLMVYYDFTFDKFHKDGDLIYRITTVYTSPEEVDYNYGVSVPLIAEVKQNLTGIQQSTAFFTAEPSRIMNASFSKAYNTPEKVIYADSDFFKFLSYEWLAGNSESAIDGPNKVVLTERRAKKYFPNRDYSDILGEILIYDDSVSTTVTGIVANFKERTDFTFEEIISLDTGKQSYMQDQITDENWNSTSSMTQLFIKLNDKKALSNVQNQLDVLAKKNESEKAVKYNEYRSFYLQPLKDLHFGKDIGIFDFTEYNADKSILTNLLFIAAFLLLLGCINFINLNTAQATQRAKEIGIRKTLGSSKQQLVFQFLWETFMLTLVAAVLSLGLAAVLLKIFADFIPEGLHFGLFADPLIIGFGVVLILIISLLSGFYPAMILSSFKPVSVLKNRIISTHSNVSIRKGLIVFQFIIAQVFVISTIVVGRQIHFMMSKDMGFKTEAITYVKTPWMDGSLQKRQLFMQKLAAIPQIESLSLGGMPPASNTIHASGVIYLDGKKEIQTDLQLLYGDDNYLNLYDIKLLAGRNLLNDTIQEYVINDTYRKLLGFKTPQDAINKIVGQGENAIPIVGVMEDFNQYSVKSKIEPMALIGDWSRKRYSQFNTIHMQLNKNSSDNWPKDIANIEVVWNSIYPESDFKIEFIDKTIAKFYDKETSMTKLLNWATGLSVLISCLGLFGLVIYTTERRVKEIGVRKILGASLTQLNVLLCKDFLVLIGIAFVIAAPLAWYGLHNWLQDYAYKTNLSWWIFALSGLGIILLSLIIMSVKTISAANENPVKSLRTE
ncbi:ABC transporter permease [Gelidibacter gilvus]|uniref:FtsX-like permease family protein n=1 Tax=Gelidibacter gilvus TaxID=59602 RepID=A0A4Q0XKV5_9FLAO|nr:FtsX-like permease family protein [Gelidibacter gilvus]RXJ51327.1 FtsX-like permease family protein [Gelidibacter gilvus]